MISVHAPPHAVTLLRQKGSASCATCPTKRAYTSNCSSRPPNILMSEPSSDLQTRLTTALAGQFEVERTLGAGGMGTVFLARDSTLDRPVAIKVISPDVTASAEIRQRFLLEARTVARLRHPNIVSVYAAGESDGLLWFAMEFVPGESLRERLQRERRLPADDVADIVHDLSLALDNAHAAGVVHRDVKPENILLDRDSGRAMLTDFGVARALSSGDSRLTVAGFVLGSPRYMSPEQAGGDSTIDGRSDLYSLGLVAYEALAGRPAVTEESAASILIKQLTAEPTPLVELSPDVPPLLEQTIARLLRKSPDERFARGADVAATLEGRSVDDNDPSNSQRRSGLASRSGSGRGSGASGSRADVNSTLEKSARRRFAMWGAGVAVAAVGVYALFGRIGTPDPATSGTWLVAPFELQTGNASLDWLREGAVNMLGLTLSQWNDLSVVDYERTLDLFGAELGNDSRRLSLDNARDIARRASAGTVVMGQITTANDSLFVVARRYDVASGRRIDEATAGAPLDGDNRVVFERIARELLDLAGGPALSVELTRQTTESVEAYRLYLDGLRALNRWQLLEADSLLAKAIAIDSTFALAYYKRSLGQGWRNIVDDTYLQTAELAVRHGTRLPPRQRDVVAGNADMVRGFVALVQSDQDAARASWNRAQQRLSALLATDSTDAEAWYILADAAFHAALNTGLTNPDSIALLLTRSMRGFERAIALDSSFHLSHEHLIQIYQSGASSASGLAIDGDSIVFARDVADTARINRLKPGALRRARTLAEAWIQQEPDGTRAWQSLVDTHLSMRQLDSAIVTLERARERPSVWSAQMAYTLPLFYLLGGNVNGARSELRVAARRFPGDTLAMTDAGNASQVTMIGMSTAAATGALGLLDTLVETAQASGPSPVPLGMSTAELAEWLAASVRLATGATDSSAELTIIRRGVATLDRSREVYARELRRQTISIPYGTYLLTRDSALARTAQKWARDGVRSELVELNAAIALDRGDTAAVREGMAAFATPEVIGSGTLTAGGLRVLLQADVLERMGELAAATELLEAMAIDRLQLAVAEPGLTLFIRSFASRGRMYEAMGERDKAIAAYETFITYWLGADDALQSQVSDAKAAIARLRDGKARSAT